MAEKTKTMDRAKKSVESKLEQARERFADVAGGVEDNVEKARRGARRTGRKVRESAAAASEGARHQYEVAKENVRHGYEKVSHDVDRWSHDVNDYVRANPGKSLLIAAGVGFLLGILFRGGDERH